MNKIINQALQVAIVPIRAGSKGLPGKNLRMLNGIPLYLHAVNQGLRTVGRVLLSTDIADISQEALPAGVTLCPSPASLATDDTPMASVIAHLIAQQQLEGQTLILLQATSPLRTDTDVHAAIELHAKGKYDLVMSVVARNREVLKYGTLVGSDFTAMRDSAHCFTNRQQLPPVYGPNGAVYVFTANQFISARGFPTRNLGGIEMPTDRSADIDTLEDFESIESRLISQNIQSP